MAITTRTVTGTVLHPSGTPWADAAVIFILAEGTYSSEGTFPRARTTVTTDEDGNFSAELWSDSLDIGQTLYTCRMPTQEEFKFILPAGDTPVSLETLRASYEVSPTVPEASLVTLIDAHADDIASPSVLGHIKVGSGLSIDAGGVLSADATQSELDAEATARVNADTTEATARANADTAEATARANADTAETAARIAADAAHVAASDPHTQYFNQSRGDARYYTETEVDTALAGKSNTGHTHTKANVTDLETITATPTSSAVPKADGSGKIADGWLSTLIARIADLTWGNITGKPSTLAGYGISDAASDSELDAHVSDTNNPHSVTAAQIGAATAAALAAHLADLANPHAVTPAQIGALTQAIANTLYSQLGHTHTAASIPSNVAYKDADNAFSVLQTVAAGIGVGDVSTTVAPAGAAAIQITSASDATKTSALILSATGNGSGAAQFGMRLQAVKTLADSSPFYGLDAYGRLSANSGTQATLIGVLARVRHNGTAALTNAYSLIAQTQTEVSGAAITAAYALYADAPNLVTGSSVGSQYGAYITNQGSTKVTNAYGLYIATQSGATSLNYSLFVQGGVSALGDRVLVRSTDTAQAAGVFVPWVTGDTLPTILVGSSSAGNNQNGVVAASNTGIGVIGTSVSGSGVRGQSTDTAGLEGITSDSGTTSVPSSVILRHRTSGTPANGYGAALLLQGNSSTTADQDLVKIAAIWTAATHATRTSALTFSTVNSGGALAEQLRLTGIGQLLIRTTTSTAASGVYIPWISGDTLPMLVAGSANASNNQDAITGVSSTGIGVRGASAGVGVEARTDDAGTTNAPQALRVRHLTTGTAAANFGVGIAMGGNTNGNSYRDAASLSATWTDATDASRKSRLTINVVDTATREGIRIEADGSAVRIGFFGATAITKPTITGSRGGNAALADLLTKLASLGLIIDSTTA